MQRTACPSFFSAAPMGRREFLRAGSIPLVGFSLPRLLQAKDFSQIKLAAPKRKAKACTFLFMWGGPAHQDTWDMKPNAPEEYRGEFQPIDTTGPALQISQHLAQPAPRADKLAVSRSMTHDDVDHTSATHYPLTGRGPPR